MPRNSATTKATGGGGYTFADNVAAGFLVHMLQGSAPFDPTFGTPTEIHFETRDTRHILDDLLVVLATEGGAATGCAVSIKSGRELTAAGFSGDFAQDAWDEWRRPGLDINADLLVLVVGVVGDEILNHWRQLQEQAASTTPDRLVARLGDRNQSSRIQRNIFESLRRVSDGEPQDVIECARLLSRTRVLHFSNERIDTLTRACTELVVETTAAEGAKLWSQLLKFASANRGTGGHIDTLKLVRHLRGHFQLRNQPDFEVDWAQVDSIASENIGGVRTVIGSNVTIGRDEEISALAATIEAARVTAVVGESGSGKSAATSRAVHQAHFKHCLWLSPEQLSHPSQTELAHSLRLRHTLPQLIVHSTAKSCVLVLDGFEQFEGAARHRAMELVQALHGEEFAGWKLIITCQARYWESVQDTLISGGITELKRMDFKVPSLQQISDALDGFPSIRTLLVRNDVQPILSNLVVLDWVVKGNIAEHFSPSRAWIGETELITYIWSRWIGEGSKRFAREYLLRLLGEREGDRLSGAVYRDSIPHDQLTLLGELADDDLVRVNGPTIRFSHDLLGDWARFHALAFARDDVAQRIKAVSPVPRWGRAIRLYAQSLAEQDAGLTRWKSLSAELAGEGAAAQLAQDLLLDGLLFATNSESLLEQVWEDLIADQGVILRRLFQRLLNVASVPDWRVALLREGGDPDQLAAWFRIPLVIYWYPALRVLSRHAQDVATHTLREAAEACVLWLKTMPPGMPGRREAAALAIALAHEAQGRLAEDTHFTEKSQAIFEALLNAAPEFPDEVAQIALELAERRPEPQHAKERRRAFQTREAQLRAEWRRGDPEPRRKPTAVFPSRSLGEMRAQAPDGPMRAVCDGFQSAVLDGLGLRALVGARPAAAREVLLAVCIEEPIHIDPYNDRPFIFRRCGLADWRRGYPSIYWKGPFLPFLQQQPAEGLDAIVGLVNFATDQWLEALAGPNVDDEVRTRFGFELATTDGTITWTGDGNVLGWHRSMSLDAPAVECALMALEKWLYDEMEAGRDVTKWVEFIFRHGRSLAFAGVLISLGLKHPRLFTRELQPLLSNYYVYQWQLQWAVSEQQEVWAIGLSNLDRQLVSIAVAWHRLPHRRSVLQDLAQWLMLRNEETAVFLAQCRPTWLKLLDSTKDNKRTLELFLARFNSANYTKTPQSDGSVLVEMHLPAHLQAETQGRHEASTLNLLSLSLAGRSRRLLRDEEHLSPEDVGTFASTLQRLHHWRPADLDASEKRYRMNSIAGGIAVLIIQHREWLSENPSVEQWCLDTVRTISPSYDEHDSPASVMDHTAESFLGEIGVALLCERDDEWVLRMVVHGITGFYYSSPWFTMWRACLMRDRLAARFDELTNVVVLWSALRRAAHRESGHFDDHAVLARYRETLFRRFVAGRLRGEMISLRRIETLGRRILTRVSRRSMTATQKAMEASRREWLAHRDQDRKLSREVPDIDPEVLCQGLGFLPRLMRNPVASDGSRANHIIRELCDLELRMLSLAEPDEGDWEIDGTAHYFEAWIMEQVAELIAHTSSVETSRSYYRPILALGPAAGHWVEAFLQAWIRVGLDLTVNPEAFETTWQDMAQYAMGLRRWQPRRPGYWNPAETISVDLMGLRKDAVAVLGQARHLDVIAGMASVFDEWAAKWLGHAMPAAWFAHFLTTESGRVLIPAGIKRLATVVTSFADRDWHEHDLGALFTQVLARCWAHLRKEVEAQPELRTAFLDTLTHLCARQVPEALHLRNKVSALLGAA